MISIVYTPPRHKKIDIATGKLRNTSDRLKRKSSLSVVYTASM